MEKKAFDVCRIDGQYHIVELVYDLEAGTASVVKHVRFTDSKPRAVHKAKELAVKNVMGTIK